MFLLQLLFSFLILNKIIKNNFFSIISSLFFLLVPFLVFRISNHFSLGAHWLILYFLRKLFYELHKKNFHWYFLIFLSLLIHLYFTVIIFVIFFCSLFVNKLKKVKFRHVFLDVSLKLFLVFF